MTNKDLVKKAKEYLSTLQDEFKDETYDTDYKIGLYELVGFFDHIGIKHDLIIN